MFKRHFTILFCLIALLFIIIFNTPHSYAYGEKKIIHRPHSLNIDVWTDKGEGTVYNVGERINIYFRANDDCYVVIYNIDT